MSPPQARQELNPSHVSILSSHQEENHKKLTILVFQVISSRDLHKQIIRIDHSTYKIIRDSPKEFGAQCRKGKCLVRSSLNHNLERGGDEPELKG